MTEPATEEKYSSPSLDDIARLIVALAYKDLCELGNQLHEMTQSDEGKEYWNTANRRDWPDFIFNWAESHLDDLAFRERTGGADAV